ADAGFPQAEPMLAATAAPPAGMPVGADAAAMGGGFGDPGFGAPGYGAPGYGAPGAAGYGAPGAPGYGPAGDPFGYGAPGQPGPGGGDRHLHAVPQGPPPTVQPAAFPTLDHMGHPGVQGDIGLLLDVPLQVTVELGRTQLRIRNVLELVPGSIIELDRLSGEPVDVLVNGRQIARGEVVVIDEDFGVRITDIASRAARLRDVSEM
ncbi:MAG: flagellar motor switch protein FliN, partial [Actinomycetota bacterium]